MLTDHRFTILKRAAARGHAHAGVATDWSAGIDRLVRAAQRPGEDYAVAYARTVATGEGRDFLKMQREAEDTERADARGRPRKHQPGELVRSRIEEALADAAMAVAKAQGLSFESAFAKVLQTPAGSDLYTALRALEPESSE
jgi:hypothetical protein